MGALHNLTEVKSFAISFYTWYRGRMYQTIYKDSFAHYIIIAYTIKNGNAMIS